VGLFKAIKNWKNRKLQSDLNRVRVTSSGAFYMETEDLFNDKNESLTLLKKLNESVENHKKQNRNADAYSE
jgi:hypothetical protein